MGKKSEQIEGEVVQVTPKEGPVDLTASVKLIATDKAPHHTENSEFEASPWLAEKMIKNGWAEKV